MHQVSDSLGIPNYGPWYFNVLPGQNEIEEMGKIHSFLYKVLSRPMKEFEGEKRLEFINYGSTQLVYVLTVNGKKRYTILISHPSTKEDASKLEFDHLSKLSREHKNVVCPFYYFKDSTDPKRELYIAPYEYQARCIGVDETKLGMWVPEPVYHFVEFSDSAREIINSSMIALLISFYDENSKQGIAQCRFDGGDFMITKGFNDTFLSYDVVLERMKLIAAREFVTMELEDYIQLLRSELKEEKKDSYILLGQKLKAEIKEEEMEKGIQLGFQLREQEKGKKLDLFHHRREYL